MREGEIGNRNEVETWQQKDVDARTILYSTTKAEQQTALHGCQTAHEMWSKIQAEYAENAAENEHLLMAKFFDYKFQHGNNKLTRKCRQGLSLSCCCTLGQSMMAFIATIEQMAAQLREL